jgi:hypothetical protein
MRPSYPISLFSAPPKRDSGPSGFVVSIVVHSCVFGMLFLGMRHVTVVQKIPNRKYMVHLLDMQESEASVHYYPPPNIDRARQQAARHAISAGGKEGISKSMQLPRLSQNFETPKPAPQTLIQPEVPPDQHILPQIPIPQAMVWTAGQITHPKIIPPVPKQTGAIPAKPSLNKPNQELNPTEMPLTSMPFETMAPMPIPGTTSPVKLNGPQPAKQLPQTASRDTGPVTPARVISLSDKKLEVGTAALPVVNEIAEADASGSPSQGQAGGASRNGNDATDSRQNGTGAGRGAGNSGDNAAGFTVIGGDSGGSEDGPGADLSSDSSGANPTSGAEDPPEHIVLPKGGQYGMVVVGASPEEDYPETANLWTGRLVYSVYLQTDTDQNWILQYALMRQTGADDPSRPDAPWPYDMMRPNLAYKDVVLVHGFVNTSGRFEQLSVAYPPGFAEAEMLLHALKRWEFRPAMNQGQPATVEILLIIPGGAD